MNSKKIVIISIIVLTLAIGGFLAWHFLGGGSTNNPAASAGGAANSAAPPVPQTFASTPNQSAYDIALARAKLWHTDAKLANMSSASGATDANGISRKWDFIFVSPEAPKKGFEVVVSNGSITSASEIMVADAGGTLPSNLISTELAIARAKAVPGYANVTVISVEAAYGPDGSQWYWSVKTSKGTVTVKATQ